jgi:hypothetical protein
MHCPSVVLHAASCYVVRYIEVAELTCAGKLVESTSTNLRLRRCVGQVGRVHFHKPHKGCVGQPVEVECDTNEHKNTSNFAQER